jgi:hypothetical protein
MLSGTSYTFRRIILAASTAKLRDELHKVELPRIPYF